MHLRLFRLILLSAFVFSTILLIPCDSADAYNYKHAHPRINQLSFSHFIQILHENPEHRIYRQYEFREKDILLNGSAVKESGFLSAVEGESPANMGGWLMHGGYSADVPEFYSSLRHFYDPYLRQKDSDTGQNVAYLTDHVVDFIDAVSSATGERLVKDPRMDARTWAITGPASRGYEENRYSWKKGVEYMRQAYAERNPKEKERLFAAAWRACGETMHLLSDMTVPAHVRNDAHPGSWERPISGYRNDPYEFFVVDNNATFGDVIAANRSNPLPKGMMDRINRCRNPGELFDLLAMFTSMNFFSADTIYGTDPVTGEKFDPANGKNFYLKPRLDDCKSDPLGAYILHNVKVAHHDWPKNTFWNLRNTARQTSGRKLSATQKTTYTYEEIAVDQARILIPLAIAGNVKLLLDFVPMVSVAIDSFDTGTRTLIAAVTHHPHGAYTDTSLFSGNSGAMLFNKGPRSWSRLDINGKPYFETFGHYSLEINQGKVKLIITDSVDIDFTRPNQLVLRLFMGGFWVTSIPFRTDELSSDNVEATNTCTGWLIFEIHHPAELYRYSYSGDTTVTEGMTEEIQFPITFIANSSTCRGIAEITGEQRTSGYGPSLVFKRKPGVSDATISFSVSGEAASFSRLTSWWADGWKIKLSPKFVGYTMEPDGPSSKGNTLSMRVLGSQPQSFKVLALVELSGSAIYTGPFDESIPEDAKSWPIPQRLEKVPIGFVEIR